MNLPLDTQPAISYIESVPTGGGVPLNPAANVGAQALAAVSQNFSGRGFQPHAAFGLDYREDQRKQTKYDSE